MTERAYTRLRARMTDGAYTRPDNAIDAWLQAWVDNGDEADDIDGARSILAYIKRLEDAYKRAVEEVSRT